MKIYCEFALQVKTNIKQSGGIFVVPRFLWHIPNNWITHLHCIIASLLQDLNQMMTMIKWWSNLLNDTNLTSNKHLNFCNDENFIDSRISLAISRFPLLELLYNRKYKRARAEKTTFLKPVSTVHGKWYIIQLSLLKI